MIVFADHLGVFAGVIEKTKRRAPGSIVPPRGARPNSKIESRDSLTASLEFGRSYCALSP